MKNFNMTITISWDLYHDSHNILNELNTLMFSQYKIFNFNNDLTKSSLFYASPHVSREMSS